ncbi:MAG: UTP--glucose-1-phosphate uridylyltransferase [Caldisericum sp. CG2_30_36_11]|nr:UTP--glucose-1-phosphate uridylyltransferase GalU [Caldisericota bacterium]NCQ52721.1 UTP--glucose-1-phosphate uridylyltransferase GalU [Caldisericota bacterium]OIP13781.1 MAG: UTP--glucose-1-phosphate uridylyltransferase [Caldisericum sp. CG2_30_36_11]
MKEIIKKAVIPVAGFGTRLLPATKSQPKEMLPIVDKPAVQYVVEEAIKSGAENILFITGRGKRAIEDYFDYAVELEKELEDKGKTDLLDEVRNISEMAKFFYVRQKIARGLGDAINHARGFIDDEYFSVLLADDIIDSEIPCLKQMINVFRNYRGMILAVMEVPRDKTNIYGIVNGKKISDRVYEVSDLIEKPEPEEALSNIAVIGRYILNANIFNAIEETKPGKGGEIQITDAIKSLIGREKIFAYEFKGMRYDVGEKIGFLKANIAYALKREDLGSELKEYLKKIVEETT